MSVIFLLLLLAFSFWMISVTSGRGQKSYVQAIEGGLEALTINILLYPLIALMIVAPVGPWHIFMSFSGFYAVIQLLYVMLRSLFLRRQHRWAKLKGLIAGNTLIVLGVCLFIWWVQSLPSKKVFPT